MVVIRKNILFNSPERDAFIRGILLLKNETTPALTTQFGIPGSPVPIRMYDAFVIWHHLAMMTPTPPGSDFNNRNAAHRGPVFLPWHRVMLAFMEQNLQRVLGDPSFGLPYWDWSVDGSLPISLQSGAPIWNDQFMGGQGEPVSTGQFAFNVSNPASFRVLIETTSNLTLQKTDRGLKRKFGVDAISLPSALDLLAAFNTDPLLGGDPLLAEYDRPDFNLSSVGFRNRLEGSIGTGLHNQVHRWIGGDMAPASSPNDPIFYLHHANVDRIWEGWMIRNGRKYTPDMTASATQFLGHRIDDPIVSPLIGGMVAATPRTSLDVSTVYKYDTLP